VEGEEAEEVEVEVEAEEEETLRTTGFDEERETSGMN
jgi:hypothetical protein